MAMVFDTMSRYTYDAAINQSKQNKSYSDFDMTLDIKTVEEFGQNNPPHIWETAWIFGANQMSSIITH